MKNSAQNMLQDSSNRLGSCLPQVGDVFWSGLQWLKALSSEEYELRFPQWANLVRQARGKTEISLGQLEWLWDAIRSEPNVRSVLGERIISLDDEWKGIDSVECAPSGSRFGIFLKGFRQRGIPGQFLAYDAIPEAYAEIQGSLLMKPVKNGDALMFLSSLISITSKQASRDRRTLELCSGTLPADLLQNFKRRHGIE